MKYKCKVIQTESLDVVTLYLKKNETIVVFNI